MIEIKRKVSLSSTWADLKTAANAGTLDTIIQSGDLISFTLKSGEEVTVRAMRDDTGKLFFVLEDCMQDEHAMNKEHTNEGGWDACEMRSYLNKDVYDLLPDDLQAVIVPTTIVQIVDGERIESKDKLFLLSTTQVFGKGDWSNGEPEDTGLDCFRRKKDRVKECAGNGIWWWWLRSVADDYLPTFYFVTSGGTCDTFNAANLFYGVVFAFCIN